MMNTGIYKIANKITGDFYIGSAVNLNKRHGNHKSALKKQIHSNKYLQNVFNKYGLDNLSFEIIELVEDKNNLIAREQFFINTLKPKYNIRQIADSNLGLKWSKETRFKMSKAKKNNKYRLGHKLSEETKLKISISERGKVLSEVTIKKYSKPFIFLSPDGKIVKGLNLSRFCKINKLPQGNMCQVLNGKRRSCKGWTNYKKKN